MMVWLWADVPEDSVLGVKEQRDYSLADLIEGYWLANRLTW